MENVRIEVSIGPRGSRGWWHECAKATQAYFENRFNRAARFARLVAISVKDQGLPMAPRFQ